MTLLAVSAVSAGVGMLVGACGVCALLWVIAFRSLRRPA